MNTKCISIKILNLFEQLSSSSSWGSETGGISSSRLAWRWSKIFSQRNRRKEIHYPCELVRASGFTQQGALEVCQGHLSVPRVSSWSHFFHPGVRHCHWQELVSVSLVWREACFPEATCWMGNGESMTCFNGQRSLPQRWQRWQVMGWVWWPSEASEICFPWWVREEGLCE